VDPSPPAPSLRGSLRACTAEGVAAEVVAGCTGSAVATAWALHLGGGAAAVALLGALPFLAQVGQLPAAWLTARLGARRAALWTVALSRQAFLPLVALPWLPLARETQLALLVALAAAHHALAILCNNAWVTWVGELVPAPLRGRYFGRRTALCTVASAATTLAVGAALDGARAAALTGPALAGLALVACAAGAASVRLMARQRGGERCARAPAWSLPAALRPFADERARRLLAYLVLWNGAVGLSAPFYGLYVLRELGAGFTALAALTAGYALARTAAAGAWGRAVDRAGARAVLLACTGGLALSPLAWIAAGPGALWPLALDALVGGALLGGHAIATFTLPLALAPPRERPHWHAAFSTAGGCAFAATAALGGALAAGAPRLLPHLPAGTLPLHLTFGASLLLRAAAAATALGLLEPIAARKSERPLARPRQLVGALPGGSPPFAPRGSWRWRESRVRQTRSTEARSRRWALRIESWVGWRRVR
jgi:MFS family permease